MRKRLAIAVGMLLLGGIGAMFWLLPRTPRAGPWKLADGSELSLAGVTYGKHHTMRYGDRFVDYLYPVLTKALRNKFGCKVTTLDTTNANAVVIWFWGKGVPLAATSGYWGIQEPPYCISVADAFGMESDVVDRPASKIAMRGTNVLYGWELKQFPRRSREMNIRVYGAAFNRDKQQFVTQFKILNRGQRKFPMWKAEPLPITVTTNGLEVTFARFTTGTEEYMFLPERKVTNYFSYAGFTLMENHQLADADWRVVFASASAASGEARDSYGWMESPGYDGLSYILPFKGTFWMEEPAWKLRVKISRIAHFPQDELWTVMGVAVPARGKAIDLNLKTNMHGSEIELFAINGPMTNFNDGVRATIGKVPPQLSVRSPLPALDTQLEIVDVKDNLGRNVPFGWDGGIPSTGGRGATIRELIQVFPITIPDGAETLDITFAYTKSVFVEFVAKPTVAKQSQ